jgi:hypothetical protein
MRVRLLAVLILVIAGSFAVWRRVQQRRQRVGDLKDAQIPALMADESEALALATVIEKRPGERRIHLRSRKGGEATLVLEARSGSSSGFGFGRARLEPELDRSRGAALVNAVAGWLHRPPPAPGRTGALEPFPLTYVVLGDDDGWEAIKLFLERGERNAEVFLNLSSDQRHARLVEKDEDYRDDLLVLLALALRDGSPPRRSPQTDPLVASMQPLFGDFQPVADGERLRGLVGTARGFLAARELAPAARRNSEVLLWKHPRERPRRVARSEGVVNAIVAAPAGELCGLAVLFPSTEDGLSSRDPSEVDLLDPNTGLIGKLDAGSGFVFEGVFSPDGRQVALAHEKATRVYDVASRKLVASTPDLDVAPRRWSPDGLRLRRLSYQSGAAEITLYRWRPGKGELQPIAAEPLSSPDGRFRLEPTPQGLAIRGPGGTRTVAATLPEDLPAFHNLLGENDPRWIGPHHLAVVLDEPMALDLATGKLHYLFSAPGLRIEASSPDGRILVAADDHGNAFWAERR